ncbi:kinase domain protein (macronuclear) [Tetrahymena thermophila SB210]|uniref:Kinase domain protein n=1 Tax=Tetrahymena thermophila (strain SB210) TaxID=312017 RepID=W7XKI6_TETTS|nr:kinase domain protein [Tetrahymena thermophila SB210]EWS76561.1 kinase domain protein [Tetrahymena thermophila SB210]|eukprot:XP_012650933.1 kinase domain protein [Tetrahymena thermophila SB210]
MYQVKAQELLNYYNKIQLIHKQTIDEFLRYNQYVYVKDIINNRFSLVVQAQSLIDQNIVAIEILYNNQIKKINHKKLEKCVKILENLADEKYILQFIQSIQDLEYGNVAIVTQNYEKNLASILENNNLTMSQIYALTYQLLKGILLFQEKGIVIKDIQPQNILYSSSKNQFLLTYHRFSKFIENSKKEHQKRNLKYLSPQVIDKIKPYNTSDDVYSVGVIILEALLQRKIQGMEYIKLKSQSLIEVIPDIQSQKNHEFVTNILCRMLDPDRNKRYQPLILLQQLNKLKVDEKQLKFLNLEVTIQCKQEVKQEFQQIEESEQQEIIEEEEDPKLKGQIKQEGEGENLLQAYTRLVKSHKQDNQIIDQGQPLQAKSSQINQKKENKVLQKCENRIVSSESDMKSDITEDQIEFESNKKEIKINNIKDINKAEQYEIINFDFRYDRIFGQGAQFLGLALQRCQKMTYLNLNFDGSYNLKDYNKKDLFLSQSQINKIKQMEDEGIIFIMQTLQKCTNLKSLNLNLSNNDISVKSAQNIANYLNQSQNILFLSLNISFNYLREGVSYIAQALAKNQNLISLNLNLRFTSMEQKDLDNIAESIGKLEKLNFLDLNLSQNFTEKINLNKLGKSLQQCKNLANFSINLDFNFVSIEAIQQILMGIENCSSLDSFSLYLQSIHNQQHYLAYYQSKVSQFVQCLCLGLQKLASISTLLIDLSCNTLQIDQIKLIADSLKKCQNIKSLNLQLRENWVDVEGLKYIGISLEESQNINELELNLENNNLGQKGFNDFTLSLSKCINYEFLDINLSQNNIGIDQAELFGQSISKLQNLKHLSLNLESNKIGKEGIKSIAQGIQACINITYLSLNLSKTNMKLSSVHVLAFCLKKCSKIYDLSLNLSRNKLQNQAAKSIGAIFSQCLSIKKASLHLEGNTFDNLGLNDISVHFQSCKQLHYLNLSLKYKNQQFNQFKLNKLSVDNQINEVEKQNLEEILLQKCQKLKELIIF